MSSSERSGGFRGWSVIHYCCHWSVIITYTDCLTGDFLRFPYWRVSVSGYQLPAIRRPSRYGATGANTLRMSPISPREIRRSVRTYVSISGLTCVEYEDWRAKCRCTDETTLLYASTSLVRMRDAGLPRAHALRLPAT